MPAPIVVPQQKSPWSMLLPQLFLQKIQHKQQMEREDLRIKAKQAEVKEQQDREAKKVTRGTPYKGKKGHMRTPVYMGETYLGEEIGGQFFQAPESGAYKEGQLQNFKVGDKIVQHKYTGGKWVSTGVEAPRYKPSRLTLNLKQSSASERENIAAGEASINTLDNLMGLFNDSYVGPVAGRVGKVKDIFGGNTEKQSEFNAATYAFKNQIIKEITGAQMSEAEAKRIMKQVPDVNDPPSVWKAKWKQSRRNISVLKKKRLEIMRKSGVRTPEDDEAYDYEFIPGKGLVPTGGS